MSPEQLCADHPELLDEVRRGIEALRQMRQRMGLPLASPKTAAVPPVPAATAKSSGGPGTAPPTQAKAEPVPPKKPPAKMPHAK
jgi:hypothetical protein